MEGVGLKTWWMFNIAPHFNWHNWNRQANAVSHIDLIMTVWKVVEFGDILKNDRQSHIFADRHLPDGRKGRRPTPHQSHTNFKFRNAKLESTHWKKLDITQPHNFHKYDSEDPHTSWKKGLHILYVQSLSYWDSMRYAVLSCWKEKKVKKNDEHSNDLTD